MSKSIYFSFWIKITYSLLYNFLEYKEKSHLKLFLNVHSCNNEILEAISNLIGKENWKLKLLSDYNLMRSWEARHSWWNTTAIMGKTCTAVFSQWRPHLRARDRKRFRAPAHFPLMWPKSVSDTVCKYTVICIHSYRVGKYCARTLFKVWVTIIPTCWM